MFDTCFSSRIAFYFYKKNISVSLGRTYGYGGLYYCAPYCMFSLQVYLILKDTFNQIFFRNLSMQLLHSLLDTPLPTTNLPILHTDKCL